jgi:gas vesicle protein
MDRDEELRESADAEGAERAERAEPEHRARGAGGFAAGVLIGALIGAGLALLFAPESGGKIRRRLGRRMRRWRERARNEIDDASRLARRDLTRRRRRLRARLDRLAAEARDTLPS